MTDNIENLELSSHIIQEIFGQEFCNNFKKTIQPYGSGPLELANAQRSPTRNGPDPGTNDESGLRVPKLSRIITPSQTSSSIENHRGFISVFDTRKFRNNSHEQPIHENQKSLTPKQALDPLQEQINSVLEQAANTRQSILNETTRTITDARLGQKNVVFDLASHYGSFIMHLDRLGLISQCHFGSIRANTCLFKGKWQYEVLLGSKGVMQIGWATLKTPFTQEKGVGDSIDSFAFDGNRLLKWNKSPEHYGDNWQTGLKTLGDIIGCCINLDDRNIEYYRNGKSLGVAFTDIPVSKGVAYFPSMSLSWGEQLTGNFGGTPFRYPVQGYNPIQIYKSSEDAKLKILLGWLENMIDSFSTGRQNALNENEKKTLEIINLNLFHFIGTFLNSEFAIQDAFLPLLAKLIGLPELSSIEDTQEIGDIPLNYENGMKLLEYMWGYLQEDEMRKCVETSCKILLYLYRGNVRSLHYTNQFYSLRLLTAFARHRKTRRFLIHHLIFDQIKLTHFMHIKPIDEDALKVILPKTWWKGKSGPSSTEALSFEFGVNVIQEHVRKLENAQISLLRLFLTNTDGTEKRPSSRSLFLRKFRSLIKETIKPSNILNQPMNKVMCTFFRILKVASELWSEEILHEDSSTAVQPDFPASMFYDCIIDFNECERLGGSTNFLFKTHHIEVSSDLGVSDYYVPAAAESSFPHTTPMPSNFGFNALTSLITSLSTPTVPNAGSRSREPTNSQSSRSSANATVTSIHAATSSPENIATETADSLSIFPPFSAFIAEFLNRASELPNETTDAEAGVVFGVIHPPSAITSFSHTENIPDLRVQNQSVSNTSSNVSINTTSTSTNTGATRQLNHAFALEFIANSLRGSGGGLRFSPMFNNEHPLRVFQGGPFFGFGNFDRVVPRPNNPLIEQLGRKNGVMDSATSLRELIDDAILIFSCGIKRHIEKVVEYRKMAEAYSEAIGKLEERLLSNTTPEQEVEIQRSIEIFTTKLEDLSRNIAWIKSAVFTLERQHYVHELLKSILASLKSASSKGVLFTFVPDYYVTTLLHLTHFLTRHMCPTLSYEDLPGIRDTLKEIAEFVASHFADERIILTDTKDALIGELFAYICEPDMLSVLENMSEESRTCMIKLLLQPNEQRAWARNNLILVRFWQGNGFAFQYPTSSIERNASRARHSISHENEEDISTLPPMPSRIFQNQIAEVLMGSHKLSKKYIHSVLNQLNWAFSEFVELLQEIYSSSNHSEMIYMESRQIRICCTYYDLTQQLLRVLEMIVNLAPSVLLHQPSHGNGTNESLLTRLCMLLSHVLNRIGNYTGTFAQVVELNITGLEFVSYYSILSSIAGLLVALIRPELNVTDQTKLSATKTLLREPSFNLKTLDFLVGRNVPDGHNPDTVFSLEHHVPDDISVDENAQLQATLAHLSFWSTRLDADNESISEDDMCTICYAYPKTTTLKPCNHRSCRPCILHHLLNRGECFFCKGLIELVIGDDGSTIFDATIPVDSEGSSTTTLD